MAVGGFAMWLSLLDLLRADGISGPRLAPELQIQDAGSHLLLTADLSQIDKRSVRVQVGEWSITVAGWGTREEQQEGPNFFRAEASAQSFVKQMPLPARVVPGGAQMGWEGDRLTVRMPKA